MPDHYRRDDPVFFLTFLKSKRVKGHCVGCVTEYVGFCVVFIRFILTYVEVMI